MARFTLPRDLYHGKGALEALKSFTGKKAMICVGGGSMKRFGFLDRAVEYLKEAGMEVELFEGIEPDPSVETVMRGAEAMMKFEPDWIIAMGGGSPIDAAKAMWIKYEYPEITFEEMCKVFGIPPLRRKAHFCAISSTSGTATERIYSLIAVYGVDGAFDYQKKLHQNIQLYTKSGAGGALPIAQGQAASGIFYLVDALDIVQQGYPVVITYPKEGVTFGIEATGIVEGAKNLDEAKAFVDWATSRKLGELFLAKKINYIPVVTGLKIDNPALDTSHVKLLSVGAEHKGDKRKEYVDRWVNEVIR